MALKAGVPVAVFEKQGGVLRFFEQESLGEALSLFVQEYKRGRLFAGKKRILVKTYPAEAVKELEESGFGREVQGYSLYR